MTVELTLQVACKTPDLPTRADFGRWAAAALDGRRRGAELTVRIVGEAESRRLNRTWRGLDRATNVLSFSAGPAEDLPPALRDEALGDLVLCAPLVRREAREQGKETAAHWAHLVVHGTLHLLGYDHAEPESAGAMEALETGILAGLGIADPYRLRSAGMP